MGGRLRHFQQFWVQNVRDKWAKQVVSKGYAIEFLSRPSLQESPIWTILPKEQHPLLWEEINQMLEKEAIVEIKTKSKGFYSTFFLVPKPDGSQRPILNLKPLNKFLKVQKFKMCTPQIIIPTLRQGDWLASIDLKDAYYQIPILESHRPFLRFAFQERIFQYNVLPFGISTAPRVFTKVLAPIVGILHEKGVRMFPYLDDCLLVARSHSQLLWAVQLTVDVLGQAGFLINLKKSHPCPVQRLQFLGVELDTLQATSFLPRDRALELKQTALDFMKPGSRKTARQFLRLLGLMAAAILMIPLARLKMRPIQMFLNSLWRAAYQPLEFSLQIPPWLITHIAWWADYTNLTQGLKWRRISPTRVLTTDASLEGWGGHLLSKRVQGRWRRCQQRQHINVLELQAVFNSLKSFLPKVRGQTVLVQTDNTTVLHYINKLGGTKSLKMCNLTMNLIEWCTKNKIDLIATHIPGIYNTLADMLSRKIYPYHEWELANRVVQQLFQIWNTPQIDLFATLENKKLPKFCSLRPCPQAEAVDALSLDWSEMFVYAFPPIPLIRQVLMKVEKEPVLMILIAPRWSRRDWYPILLNLLVDFPIRLPGVKDLVTQQKGSAASSQSNRVTTGGLDDQRNRLLAEGLSQEAAETLLASRSENTNKSYQSGWKHFTRWCENRNDDPFTTTITKIVNYLQSCLNDGLSYNTVSLRVNAIQAHHYKYRDGGSLRCTPKIQRFLKGSFVKYPPVKDRVPSWDLPTVLEAMKRAPFEPLQTIPLNLLTFKTIFLLGICSAKRIGELQSLDCRPPFCSVGEGGIVLRPNAQFIPKVPSLTNIEQTLEFSPFGRDSRNPEGTDRAVCVCRAVKIYLQRTKNLRQTHQLFVTYKQGDQGRPVKTQTIATWLKKAISMGHDLQDKPLEGSVKAHSVRKQSCSWADVKCASILDICKQACWQSSNTFVQHYKLDVARTVSERHGQLVLQATHDH